MERLQAVTRCQHCNVKLAVTGLEELGKDAAVASRHAGLRSMMTGTAGGRLEESFVVLDPSKHSKSPLHGKTLEESFLMVAGSAVAGRFDNPQAQSLPQGISKQDVDERFQQLAMMFEIASGETKVDQPLCLQCANTIKKEIESSMLEAEAECAAYEQALEALSKDSSKAMPDEVFERECEAIEAELRETEAKAKQAEGALEEAQGELGELRRQAQELEGLEEDYWHAANHLSLQLQSQTSHRVSLQRKILRNEEHLQKLRKTNVYNDVFNIWYDGPFGTISGFRLGRTSSVPVEWEEINAAWGQAVLLLHTMSQACKMTFPGFRLHPMGSFSKIADKRGTMELFGPVTKLYCNNYDRAMVSFLACLKEFYEFAQGWDKAEGRNPLELVYAIEGDLVGGLSIKYLFCKDSKWTMALKYTLANLKWALAWMTSRQNGQVLVKTKHRSLGA